MKPKRLWMVGILLLLSSCRSDQLPITRPTSTKMPVADATAMYIAKATATQEARVALEMTVAKVNDWVMKFLPHSGPEAGLAFTVDDEARRIEIIVNPKVLARMTDYKNLQTPEPIPHAYWPSTLINALAGQDPSITVELIPGITIITPTLQITDTLGK